MPRTLDYTVAYDAGEQTVDLCKILFGGDGSYYLTAPYHPQNRAIAAKVTVNYADGDGLLDLQEAEELAVLDDDERRLKVAHHPDGFLQFSGEGVRSGKEDNGEPKGIGTFSYPLQTPTLGPSFQLVFSDPLTCGRPTKGRQRTVVLPESEIEHMRKEPIKGLTIIGYYLPTPWREFVHRGADGEWWLQLIHPQAQAVKQLRVVMASVDSDLSGFIGLEARPHGLEEIDGQPAFFLTTATGNLRRNTDGQLLGDQLLCMYPQPDLGDVSLPSLNFALPEPPYETTPGTTEIIPGDTSAAKSRQRRPRRPPRLSPNKAGGPAAARLDHKPLRVLTATPYGKSSSHSPVSDALQSLRPSTPCARTAGQPGQRARTG
jgi:hypothetical protein